MKKYVSIFSVLMCWIMFDSTPANAFTLGVKQSVSPTSVLPQGGYLAVNLSSTLQVQIGLGYLTASAMDQGWDIGMEDLGDFSLLVPSAGLKLFLEEPAESSVATYVFVGACTAMPSIEGPNISSNTRRALEDDFSFIGVSGALGAEYFISDSFSIGGEIGLNVWFFEVVDEGSADIISTYSAVTVSYHLSE